MATDTPMPKTPIFDNDMFEPVPAPRSQSQTRGRKTRATLVTSEPDPAVDGLEMTIPGPVETAARDVEAVSPEGRPAEMDAKAGPGRMMMEIGLVVGLTAIVSIGIAVWINVWLGLATLALGLLAAVFNPVVAATAMRAGDRAKVIRRREP